MWIIFKHRWSHSDYGGRFLHRVIPFSRNRTRWQNDCLLVIRSHSSVYLPRSSWKSTCCKSILLLSCLRVTTSNILWHYTQNTASKLRQMLHLHLDMSNKSDGTFNRDRPGFHASCQFDKLKLYRANFPAKKKKGIIAYHTPNTDLHFSIPKDVAHWLLKDTSLFVFQEKYLIRVCPFACQYSCLMWKEMKEQKVSIYVWCQQ